MQKRVLHLIASCDLPHYVEALASSIADLWPGSDILIVDNGSTRPEMDVALNRLISRYDNIVVTRRRENDVGRKVGSLYEAYNYGIDYALERGYDAINFLNDDFELLWYSAEYVASLLDFLAADERRSIVCLLFPRLTGRTDGYEAESSPLIYKLEGARVIDHGLMLTDFIRRTGFRYVNRENQLPGHLESAQLQAYLARHPMFAAIAWPVTRRAGRLRGREQRPVGGRYFEPLSSAVTAALRQRASDRMPVMEEWVRTRLPTLVPYCVTAPDLDWWSAIRRHREVPLQYLDAAFPAGQLPSANLWRCIVSALRPHHPGFLWVWWTSYPFSPFVLALRFLAPNLGIASRFRRLLEVRR
ncbi:glycosyltransferase [Undibacter mobilis]|uniref:Glycosyltransferase n=1 Tax=Undibacter mobilis TaxID=2292256 RepID=A0A371B6D4_9BRAD|nr:glycosyltransferase [Undibacter mobilis]RDV03149.1 glycosyltransferase [Undibacter mobilis]